MDEKQQEEMYMAKTIKVLRGHVNELGSMEQAIRRAATDKTEIPQLKDIFKELSDAAAEIHSTNEYYEDEAVPAEIKNLIRHTLQRVTECASALVLYSALIGFKGASN